MAPIASFDRGSSPVDWCEPNYAISPWIAEFFNTISNGTFLLLACTSAHLYRAYGRRVNRKPHVYWSIYALIGLCSAYFHATLSLVGQILDEVSILWLIFGGVGLFLPIALIPAWLNKNRGQFQTLLFITTMILTPLGWLYPWINAFAMMILAVPVIKLVSDLTNRVEDEYFIVFSRRTIYIWLFGFVCWISDRSQCGLWTGLHFPYLHAIFHVCSAVSVARLCSICAFSEVIHEYPALRPSIAFWPRAYPELGLAYVQLEERSVHQNGHQK